MTPMRFASALLLGATLAACSDHRGADRVPCAGAKGSAFVTVRATLCPSIQTITVSSLSPKVGQPVELVAAATDEDSSSLIFAWTTDQGTITNPNVAITAYRCATAGVATITLEVSDGACVDQMTVEVACQP